MEEDEGRRRRREEEAFIEKQRRRQRERLEPAVGDRIGGGGKHLFSSQDGRMLLANGSENLHRAVFIT